MDFSKECGTFVVLFNEYGKVFWKNAIFIGGKICQRRMYGVICPNATINTFGGI